MEVRAPAGADARRRRRPGSARVRSDSGRRLRPRAALPPPPRRGRRARRPGRRTARAPKGRTTRRAPRPVSAPRRSRVDSRATRASTTSLTLSGHAAGSVAALGEVAGELADEERVPVGAVVDPPGVGGAVEQRPDLIDREALDRARARRRSRAAGLRSPPAAASRRRRRRGRRRARAACRRPRRARPAPSSASVLRSARWRSSSASTSGPACGSRGQGRLDLLPLRRLASDRLREGGVRDERLLLARAVEHRRSRALLPRPRSAL